MSDALDHDDGATDPLEIAADWVDELATLTPERRAELQAWLQAAPENAAALVRMQKLMSDVALVEAAEGMVDKPAPVFEPPQPRRGPRAGRAGHTASGRFRLPLVGAGAGLAAAAALAVALLASPALRPASAPTGPSPGQTYATAVGVRSDVTLADRSVMHLNADSRVAVRYSGSARDIRLERGEAMFDVAHDAAHPFNVAAGAVTVTDLGTVFDVERVLDATEIRVFQGSVSVAAPGASPRVLNKGERLTLDPRRGAVQDRFDPADNQTWRTDWMQADNMPLKYAIARLNRYSAQTIALDDPSRANAPLTGRFDLRRSGPTLTMIGALLQLKVMRRGRELHLERAGSN
jgi:transmembrane sensor